MYPWKHSYAHLIGTDQLLRWLLYGTVAEATDIITLLWAASYVGQQPPNKSHTKFGQLQLSTPVLSWGHAIHPCPVLGACPAVSYMPLAWLAKTAPRKRPEAPLGVYVGRF